MRAAGDARAAWLAHRFTAMLEAEGDAPRVGRGRTYAAQGAVSRLRVRAGEVAARVQGSRAQPYRVSLIAAVLDGDQWDTLARALAGQPVFRAALLAGAFPPELERVFDVLGLRMLPRALGDLVLTCSCPDWELPCKHAAAVLFVLADELAADPFLLVEWLGRPRGALLADLRRHARRPAAAAEGAAYAEPDPPAGPEPELPHDASGFWRAPVLPPLPALTDAQPAPAVTGPPPPADPETAEAVDVAGLLAPLYARLERGAPEPEGDYALFQKSGTAPPGGHSGTRRHV